jgi:hypothetical protein
MTPTRVVHVGVSAFAEDLRRQQIPLAEVAWRPWGNGSEAVRQAIHHLAQPEFHQRVASANATALARFGAGRADWVGMRRAREAIPGMADDLILHAGPPIAWEHMSGPLRGAVLGALVYERRAADLKEAERVAASGAVRFAPCHQHGAVGPMAGVISASMPVFEVENATFHNRAFATINEGLGKVLRFGAHDAAVLQRLRWMATELAPCLRAALASSGPVDLLALMAQALHMGDEGHNRNKAASSLFARALGGHLARANRDREAVARALDFIAGNDHFFLNLGMAACKALLDPLGELRDSSVVWAMARNGTEVGIRMSGTGGQWFRGPAPAVEGLYFPGYGPADANPDIGDSAIAETAGIGGFASAGAPAIVQFVGGTPEGARRMTEEMYQITMGESQRFTIPTLDFRGTPTLVDAVKVVRASLTPALNTGIAHREAGVGQIGAGLVRLPLEPFAEAVVALAGSLR